MAGPKMQGAGYDLERSIEVNFQDVLKKRGEAIDVEAMKAMSNEEIEAMQMQMEAKTKKGVKYVTRIVETTIDDNPQFHQLDADGLAGPGGPFPARLRPDRPQHAGRAPRSQRRRCGRR